MLLEEYESFSERAKLMTQIHACKKKKALSVSNDGKPSSEQEISPKRKSKTEKDLSEKKKVEKKRSLKRL